MFGRPKSASVKSLAFRIPRFIFFTIFLKYKIIVFADTNLRKISNVESELHGIGAAKKFAQSMITKQLPF